VDVRNVVGLEEGVQRRLPVHRDLDLLVPEHAHAIERGRVEEARGRSDRLAKRRSLRIHVDEDEAAPGVDLAGDEAQVLLLEQLRSELVGQEHVAALAVEVPGPAVEGAADASALEPTASGREAATAMSAGVLEGAQATRRAQDQDRLVSDPVLDVVAGLADEILAAGDLPDARPEALELEREEVRTRVALRGNELPDEVPARVPARGAAGGAPLARHSDSPRRIAASYHREGPRDHGRSGGSSPSESGTRHGSTRRYPVLDGFPYNRLSGNEGSPLEGEDSGGARP